MNAWLIWLVILGLLVAVVVEVIWAFKRALGVRRSPGNRGRLAVVTSVLFGVDEVMYLSGGLLSFVVGLGLTDVAAEAFWPQYDNQFWLRAAGGLVTLIGFLSSVELLRKLFRGSPVDH
jgi:hypothetical protein